MNKIITSFALCFLLCTDVFPQDVTFSEHVVPIILSHCAPCHRPDGTAPFSLLAYKDIAKRASFIQHATDTKLMPPRKANPHYSSFANEKLLSDKEIKTLKDWVQKGIPAGPPEAMPRLPAFASNSQLEQKPDLVMTMREPFVIKGDNEETCVCYKIPYQLSTDMYAKAIEFVPGNRKVVRHVSYQIFD